MGRKLRGIVFVLCALFVLPSSAQVSMQALGDSLMLWTGFSRIWSPTVRVKSMRISGNNVTLNTNATLKDVRWTPDNIAEIKRKVSLWTLGHENGKVTIYSGKTDIESLVTSCAKTKLSNAKCAISNGGYCDLTERNIALWPSHGLYYNRDRDEWIWQRATLWTTVEDLYSQEYVRLVKSMLENAGANVLMPRAGLDHPEPGQSGMPRWTEGARYWLMNQQVDSVLWDLYEGDEYKDDMKCRAMWVNSLDTTIDLCLALHTDGQDSGDDTTIIGTLVIYTAKDDVGQTTLCDGRDREKTNRNLADWIQTQVTEDLRHIAPEWTRRQLKEANYCESRVPVVPSIILELLSHKNMADMRYGLNPQFRFTASRAVYKGILRFLNGANATVQPLPVMQLGINPDGLLQWEMPIDTLEPSAVPSYYMVYIQADDGEWDVQQVENKTQIHLDLKPNVRYNYYVVAGNDGGLSLPSPVISAYINAQNDQTEKAPMVLVVDAFDDSYGPEWFSDSTYAGIVPGSYACENYLSCAYIGQQWDYTRSHPWINDDNCGWGACYRDHAGQITVGNTHDYSVQHGKTLHKMQLSYVSCTDHFAQPDSTFALVDFVCGRDRMPLNDSLYIALERYLAQGGRMLLSSDHIDAIDAIWCRKYLHASYYANHATRSGHVLSPYHKPFQIIMEPNEEQLFTSMPQALKPEKEAIRMATYEDMRCTAAVGYKSPAVSTLVYGFPLETVQDFERIYKQAVQWLLKEK
jgi:N-acetylmuramoyl-L-alanine amidase